MNIRIILAAGALLLLGAAANAQAPQAEATSTVSCPPRVVTESARVVGAMPPGDFRMSIQGSTMAFLMDVEIRVGESGTAAIIAPTGGAGTLRRSWALPPGRDPIAVACRYEGGILLTRAVPANATACTATLLSRDHGDGGWWYFGGATANCK